MNKSFITNMSSVLLFVIGWYVGQYIPAMNGIGEYIKNAGLFAVSGAFTNWLAVYMLFEKVPLLYGSGVIPNNFEQFKSTIKDMIMNNFFTEEQFDTLSHDTSANIFQKERIMKQIDENIFFDGFVESIKESPFGSMLAMIGGDAIIEKLRLPMCAKIKAKMNDMMDTIDISSIIDVHSNFATIRQKVEAMIDTRLATLSAEQVKHMVADMIKKHLGWLVVWGGVFGGMLGIISTIIGIAGG